MKYAGHQFTLNQKIGESEVTKREHLLALQKKGMDVRDELEGPGYPELLGYLYEWFIEISSGRTYSMGGPNPISWTDIESYNRLMGRKLKKWEVKTIKQLDIKWINTRG